MSGAQFVMRDQHDVQDVHELADILGRLDEHEARPFWQRLADVRKAVTVPMTLGSRSNVLPVMGADLPHSRNQPSHGLMSNSLPGNKDEVAKTRAPRARRGQVNKTQKAKDRLKIRFAEVSDIFEHDKLLQLKAEWFAHKAPRKRNQQKGGQYMTKFIQ